MRTLVMKFGGASVSNTSRFAQVAEIIEKISLQYDACVVVVSAMANMTDRLIQMAKEVHPDPTQREYDMLISVGERVSISLLAMALQIRGIKAVSFTGSQSGIITSAHHGQAKIIDVRPFRLLSHLQRKEIAIVAGFQGVSESKEITTLGRGGSDTSAVALAVALGAECVNFYKDVSGIYDKDPNKNPNAIFQERLTYDEAIEIVGNENFILHPRCIKLAQKNSLPLNVLSFKNYSKTGTVVADSSIVKVEDKFYEEVHSNL